MKSLYKEFKTPSSAYRGKPFWAWNGKLDADELRRQIRVFHRMGLGGGFMHSRVGLGTAYLSEEWFRMIEACVDECAKLGIEAWLYDEDRWPSGAAGGLVTCDERYRQRMLRVRVVEPKSFRWKPELLAGFSTVVDGAKASSVKRLRRGAAPGKLPAGTVILCFDVVQAAPSPWYNGQTYLDTLSHEAVQRFIEVTHEAYRKNVGDHFGKVVPGIFTDEPNHQGLHFGFDDQGRPVEGTTAWTPALPRVFKARYGYDIIGHLPEIFFDVDGAEVSRARWHYHDCKAFLFSDAFARQIGEWCDRNGLMHTGHVLWESPMTGQAQVATSAMRFYEHMQAPGIDILTESNREYDTAKQCSSVARQCGRRWMLSELYGCTGWQFPFEAHKAVGDWQAALGVNLRCPHLSWFTMAGQAKRDYPASIFFQSPWWQLYPKVEDYFARVNVVNSAGQPVRDLLVVHPIESTWVRLRAGADLGVMDQRLIDLRDWLLSAHVDFDYGDEEMMSRLSRVRKTSGGPRLTVGKAAYRAVLVPPMLTVRSTTLRLLDRFARAGGQVIFAGEAAAHVDAAPSDAARQVAARCVGVRMSRAAVQKAARPAGAVLSITGQDGKESPRVLYMLREDGKTRYLLLVNTDRKSATGPLSILIDGPGRPEEWDPVDGAGYEADWRRAGASLRISTEMEASGSRVFVIPRTRSGKLARRPTLKETRRRKLGARAWPISLSEPNALVLDRPRYRVGGGRWKGSDEVLRVDQAVRTAAGLAHRGGQMVQPWARAKEKDRPGTPVDLSYRFEVKDMPVGPVELAIEQPGRLVINLNGHPVDSDADCGWWVDPCLRRLPIDAAVLRKGANELRVATRYQDDSDLEICFLLGDFGVAVRGTEVAVGRPVTKLNTGDWVRQGLPFYSGAVSYRARVSVRSARGERAVLCVPKFQGSCVRVLVNGQTAGVIGWKPYEVDITDFVGDGPSEITIEVMSHRRNSFGPLHQARPENAGTGPWQFVTAGDRWCDGYNLHKCGLMASPYMSYRKKK